MIRFRCPCGKKLKADESIIGRKVKCAKCGKINTVPPESTATSSRDRNRKQQGSLENLAEEKLPGISSSPDNINVDLQQERAVEMPVHELEQNGSANFDSAAAGLDADGALDADGGLNPDGDLSQKLGSPALSQSEASDAEVVAPKRKKKLEFREPVGGVPEAPKRTPKPSSKQRSTDRPKKSSNEKTANSEPLLAGPPEDSQSLLASGDGSSGRFKAPPELDPDPSEELIGVEDDFADVLAGVQRNDSSVDLSALEELDVEALAAEHESMLPTDDEGNTIQIDTEFEPQFKLKSEGNNHKTLLLFVVGMITLFALLGGGYLVTVFLSSGPPSYPQTFESLAEVQRFRTAVINYEKSRRQYKVAGELLFKTKGGNDEEIQAYRDFLESTKQPTVDETLQKALQLFRQPDSVDQAKQMLRDEAEKLDREGPKILVKAIEFDQR